MGRNYRPSRWKRGFRKWRRGVNLASMGRSALRFGANSLFSGIPQAVSSEAKRFINAVDDGAGGPLSTFPVRKVLTQIPRNLTALSLQSDNRESRKIKVHGVSVKLNFRSANTFLTGYGSYRLVIVRQQQVTEDITGLQYYVPVGATRNVRVLYDKHFKLAGQTVANTTSQRMHDFYLKMNNTVEYQGGVADGSDTDRGTLVLYLFTDVGINNLQVDGGMTLHYREMV